MSDRFSDDRGWNSSKTVVVAVLLVFAMIFYFTVVQPALNAPPAPKSTDPALAEPAPQKAVPATKTSSSKPAKKSKEKK